MEPEILQTVQSFTAHVPLLKSITMKLTQNHKYAKNQVNGTRNCKLIGS